MKQIYILLFILVALPEICHGQQDPLYSQYMFNMLGINPAYAGSREVLSMTAMYRRQWVGVTGSPTTQFLSADVPLAHKKVGLGVQVFNDAIGISNATGAYVSYAYRIRFRRGVFSMGLQGGVTRFHADYASVKLNESGTDQAFVNNLNQYIPNFGAGVYYSTDRWYVGLSTPHIIGKGTNYDIAVNYRGERQITHLMLASGFVWDLSPTLALKPSLLLRMVPGAPLHIDLNANLWFYKTVGVGVSVRDNGTIVGMLEMQISRQFRFGYAYDYTTNNLKNSGSHELMVRYEFGFEKNKMVSPRFF